MAVLDRIASHSFLSLKGSPYWPTERVKPIQREGVDGTAFLLTGKAGKPFTLVSTVDVEDMEAGVNALEQYQSLVGSVCSILIGGVNYASRNKYVMVLDVQQESLHAIGTFTGGLNSPSGAVLVTRWELLAVEVMTT